MSGREAPAPRVAIVTGAARGIGAAIASRLASEGCAVAVLDLTESGGADTVADIRKAGGRAEAIALDVGSESSVQSACAQVARRLGPPSVLVNNAGVLRDKTVHKTSIEEWDQLLDVNLRGAFLMSRELTPFLKTAEHGRIVNLSSTAALGAVGLSAYSAAKAGIQGLTKTLAIELARYGTTVNAVAPGFVASRMTAEVAERSAMAFEEMQQRIAREVPLGRVGYPEDIAHAVSFFVDPRSSYVTGQILYVAGGPRC